MPDEPGQLLNISRILSEENANIIKLDHNQFKTLDRFKQVQLEVTVETNGHEHVRNIIRGPGERRLHHREGLLEGDGVLLSQALLFSD